MRAKMSDLLRRALKGGFPCLFLVIPLLIQLGGCDSCISKQKISEGPVLQTPASPAAAPPVPTPGSPLPYPAAATESGVTAAPQEEAPQPPSYGAELVLNIKPGMSYEEVREILGDPGVVVAGTEEQNVVYRWSASGVSFMGRFENGELIRKNLIASDEPNQIPDEETRRFDQSLFEQIQPGMSIDDVLMIIGMDAQPLSAEGSTVKLYKWTDAEGSSITARFENKKLVRKSGAILSRSEAEHRAALPETRQPAEDMASDEMIAVEEEDIADEAQEQRQEYGSTDDGEILQQGGQQKRATISPTELEQKSKVHVIGSKRRERELSEDDSPYAGRSYRPKTKLPEFKRSLRSGSYEILFQNTTAHRAQVALISEEGGMELNVPPNGRVTKKVGRGTYNLYFIYDNDPYTLHQGQSIPVKELLVDFVVYLFDDSSEVNLL
ncbi:MAG: hypothetical protein GX117_08005 [Candidatus Hydrogenedentes bacterium]|nr:hypothetical protein [Candidatus Hydrogenedentota bacterium]